MQIVHLMPHQEKVLDVTADKNRCAYYLDMGLGKTFVGAEKMWELNKRINLVICQKSKIDDWIDHFKTYYPDDCYTYNLTTKQEFKYFQNDVLHYGGNMQLVGVINYDLIFRRSYFAHIENFTLMLDESSLISNETAKRSKFILKMHPENVVLLSGTPTAGKYERLWSQLHLLGWEIGKKAFWKSYVETQWIENGSGFKQEVIVGYKSMGIEEKLLLVLTEIITSKI